MDVTVEHPGGDTEVVELEGERSTYGDILEATGVSPQEGTVIVRGRPVPADAPVEADRVTVLRLITGG